MNKVIQSLSKIRIVQLEAAERPITPNTVWYSRYYIVNSDFDITCRPSVLFLSHKLYHRKEYFSNHATELRENGFRYTEFNGVIYRVKML